MTLSEAGQIFAYWADNPPVHLIVQAVARLLGWKPKEVEARGFSDIAAMAPPGLAVAASGDIGMPAPELDLEAMRARNRSRLARTPGQM